MKRVLGAVCVAAFALFTASGCGGDKNGPSGQPKLANPDDPKVKGMSPASPGAGGVKQQQQPTAQ